MIVDDDVERGGGLGEAPGRRDVGRARPRIAARMVVGDDEAGDGKAMRAPVPG
jgi:hypothetical protein